MRKTIILSFALVLLSTLVSCEASRNREKSEGLKLGMTKAEVIAIMGEPVKDEKYCRPDVLFYYAYPQWSDGAVTSDECLPLVFEKDKLIGVGREFYKDYRQKDWK